MGDHDAPEPAITIGRSAQTNAPKVKRVGERLLLDALRRIVDAANASLSAVNSRSRQGVAADDVSTARSGPEQAEGPNARADSSCLRVPHDDVD